MIENSFIKKYHYRIQNRHALYTDLLYICYTFPFVLKQTIQVIIMSSLKTLGQSNVLKSTTIYILRTYRPGLNHIKSFASKNSDQF